MPSTGGPEEAQAARIPLILAAEEGWDDALEHFVAHALVEAGRWSSWRWTDGIGGLRVHERSPEHVRVCGHIYEIAGPLLVFWLDLDTRGGALDWTLYFDIAPGKPARFRRNAIHLIAAPEDVTWEIVLRADPPSAG